MFLQSLLSDVTLRTLSIRDSSIIVYYVRLFYCLLSYNCYEITSPFFRSILNLFHIFLLFRNCDTFSPFFCKHIFILLLSKDGIKFNAYLRIPKSISITKFHLMSFNCYLTIKFQ